MEQSGADKLLACLQNLGVDTIFGYPGGAVLPIYDALVNFPDIQHILVRHEQGAAHAADAYARASGKVGVCLATSGPGATNILTGLATAMMDSVPMIALTGQVPLPLVGTDAFQEIDTFGLSIPVTKHSFFVERTEDIPKIIHEAMWLAKEGRPGPVLIDIPKDILLKSIVFEESPINPTENLKLGFQGEESDIDKALELLKNAKKPVFYVGGGAKEAHKEILEISHKMNIPVTTTLMSLGTIPADDPLFLGMPGMHGTERANLALYEADLVFAIGTRFDDRVTGKAGDFAQRSKKIQIDNDVYEMGKNTPVDVRLVGDAKIILEKIAAKVKETSHSDWNTHLSKYDNRPPLEGAHPDTTVSPEVFFQTLKEVMPRNTFVATDVGQHQMWCAQHVPFYFPGALITSGGLGTMGFGVPAAMGAKMACPDQPVIAIVGDGGFQMTCQELSTIAKYNIPVKIIILDNACLGMVRQWQELFHKERYSEIDLSDNPDFVKLSEVYRVPAQRLDRNDQLKGALSAMFENDGPQLLHVLITANQNVYPIVPPGAAPQDMLKTAEEVGGN